MTSRKNSSRKLSFQTLEDRQLMAGNITAAVQNHSLVINSTSDNNYVYLGQTGNGQYTLSGAFGTTINGQSTPQTLSGVTQDFKITLKGTQDVLWIVNGNGSSVTIPHNLQANLGSGGNDLLVTAASVQGSVSITGGSGESGVEIDDSMIGSPSVNSGKNDCNINLGKGSVTMQYTPVERDLKITLGGNNTSTDSVDLGGGDVGRNLTIQTGDGNDNVTMYEFSVQNKLQIKTSGGNDEVDLGEEVYVKPSGATFFNDQYGMYAANISVDLGSGNDKLRMFGVDSPHASYLGNTGVDAVFNDDNSDLSGSFSGFETMPHVAVVKVTPPKIQLGAKA
jgi:hypothetical protein